MESFLISNYIPIMILSKMNNKINSNINSEQIFSRKQNQNYNEINIKKEGKNNEINMNKDSCKSKKFISQNSKNFIPKKNFNKNYKDNDQEINKTNIFDFNNNYIFQYYYSTINYLKQYNNNIEIKFKVNSLNNIKSDINNKDENCDDNKEDFDFTKINIKKNKINNYNENKNNNYNNCFYSKNKNIWSNLDSQIEDISQINNNLNKEDDNIISNLCFETNKNLDNIEFNSLINNLNYPPFIPSNFKNKNNKNEPNNNLLKNIEQDTDSQGEKFSPILSEKIINKDKISSFNKFEKINIKNNETNNQKNEYLIEMFGKKGWICILCNNFNYETRIKCNRCGALKKPKKIINKKEKLKNEKTSQNNQSNDWICSNCKNLNYSFRNICYKCLVPRTHQQINKSNYGQNEINKNYFPLNFISRPFIIFNNMPNIIINNISNIVYYNNKKK